MSIGIQLIAQERWRQQAQENYDSQHDDSHDNLELGWAAAAYTASYLDQDVDNLWPWDLESFKVSDKVRDLTKAGALIAAELDRVLRKEGITSSDMKEQLKENGIMKEALGRISRATRIDGANDTYMGWSDMKSVARSTLSVIDEQ